MSKPINLPTYFKHPYYLFQEQGYETEVFSPNDGKCEADGMSDADQDAKSENSH